VRACPATATRAKVARARVLGRAAVQPGDVDAAVRELTAIVEDESDAESYYAAYALGDLGPLARPARSALALRVVDAESTIRGIFAGALLAIDPSVPGLAFDVAAAAARDGFEPGFEAMVRVHPIRGTAAANV